MSAISDEYGEIHPRYFCIVHALRRRIRVRAPSLRKDAERIYDLEILLRKRPSIRRVRSVPHLGTLVIDFEPAHLSLPSLIRLLDAVIPGLGHGNAGSDSPEETGRTTCTWSIRRNPPACRSRKRSIASARFSSRGLSSSAGPPSPAGCWQGPG